MRLLWHSYIGSDWFEVFIGTERIFVGHPEDFWLEFPWYARKHGILDVQEEVTV